MLVTGPGLQAKAGLTHQELARRLVALPEVAGLLRGAGVAGPAEPLALDLLRDIATGAFLTAARVGELLGVKGVTTYHALEREAVRYKQSEACRLRTDTGHSAFLKRIVLRELPSAAVKAR